MSFKEDITEILGWKFSKRNQELAGQIISLTIKKLEGIVNPHYKSAIDAYGELSYNAYPEFAIYQEAIQAMKEKLGG